MALTKKIFGARLILKIEDGYDCKKISEWAEDIYYRQNEELERTLKEIIFDLSMMNILGIEMSQETLINLAIDLIKS